MPIGMGRTAMRLAARALWRGVHLQPARLWGTLVMLTHR
jgi:hypothetical protein